MVSVKILQVGDLDLERYARLQREAFQDILAASGVSDHFMTPEYYKWKYYPPAGPAKIAVVIEDNAMVSSNAILPFQLAYGDKTVIGWQSCDSATLPQARGKSHHTRCLISLKEELKDNEVCFGFPNKNSIHNFRKLGFKNETIVTTWINVFHGLFRKANLDQIEEIHSFGHEQDVLSAKLVPLGGPMVVRDSSYLNWRYHQHPAFQYVSFGHRENGKQKGFIVLRLARLYRVCFVLIMELWGLNTKVEHILLERGKAWALERRTRGLAMMNSTFPIRTGLRSGFVPVPSIVLPKKQVLVQFANESFAQDITRLSWRVQCGDWDAF